MEEERCILCGSAGELAERRFSAWRASAEGLEERRFALFTCGPCRIRMRRLGDARALWLTPTPAGHLRFRMWDVGAAMVVLAVAYAIAAAAGWLGGWAYFIALAFLFATVPVMLVARQTLSGLDERRAARWAASDEGRAFADLERSLRDAWERASARWRDGGWETRVEEGGTVRTSLDAGTLADANAWSGSAGAEPRRADPPRARSTAVEGA